MITGHKSSLTKALAIYERPTVAQKQGLSMIPAGSSSSGPTSFSTQINKVASYSNSKQVKNPGIFQIPELILLVSVPMAYQLHHQLFPQSINIGVGFSEFASSDMDEFDSIVTEVPMDNLD